MERKSPISSVFTSDVIGAKQNTFQFTFVIFSSWRKLAMDSLTNKPSQSRQLRLDPKQDEVQLQKQARRRDKIIKEIMATEETYHRHLKLMADVSFFIDKEY
jgi:hypothetical protein